MRELGLGLLFLALVSCTPVGQSSGYIGSPQYKRERAMIEQGTGSGNLSSPPSVSSQSLDGSSNEPMSAMDSTDTTSGSDSDDLAQAAQAALGTDASATSDSTDSATTQVADAQPSEAVNALGISKENDFQAVGEERTIQQDKEFIAENRARYPQVEPTALPQRAGTGPNIAAYALQTSNPVGTPIYKRSSLFSQSRYNRNCAKYASPDLAQAAFLADGGPARDRMGLDPDGDGYACSWDPTPFRKAANASTSNDG